MRYTKRTPWEGKGPVVLMGKEMIDQNEDEIQLRRLRIRVFEMTQMMGKGRRRVKSHACSKMSGTAEGESSNERSIYCVVEVADSGFDAASGFLPRNPLNFE